MPLVYRLVKGTPLTFDEMDSNLTYLDNIINTQVTGNVNYVPIFNTSTSITSSVMYQALGNMYISGGLDVKGNNIITGSLLVTGSTVLTGIVSVSGSLFVSSSAQTVGQFVGNNNGFVEFSVRNISTGISASGDIAVYADNGTPTSSFIDIGINNSGVTPGFSFGRANDSYVYNTGGNLFIGNNTAFNQPSIQSQSLHLFANSAGTPDLTITGSRVGIQKSGSLNATLDISGSTIITGSLSQGRSVIASGIFSHAQGSSSIASGQFSHAEGENTIALGTGSHAEGLGTVASGSYQLVIGQYNNPYRAPGAFIVGNGGFNEDNDFYTSNLIFASGTRVEITGSLAQGASVSAAGIYSHAQGNSTSASGQYSHAEGNITTAQGNYSHAEGWSTRANGLYSHAEGENTLATGQSSHVEGYNGTAAGQYSHAEGYQTSAQGQSSHAEGQSTTAIGNYSHAEGYFTTAQGSHSHAEGNGTVASGSYSHAEGVGTVTSGSYQHVQGAYNIPSSVQSAFILGNGGFDDDENLTRSNLIFAAGTSVQITGSLTVTTGSGTEFQVLSTGIKIGNAATDNHTVTGSLNISGSTTISGSFTVVTGSGIEFQVLDTGVKIGNLSTDNHNITGSLRIS